MKMKQVLIALAAMVVFVAANLNAQTPQVIGIGSSAMWLELGQASASVQGCSWTVAKGTVVASDSRVSGTASDGGTAENGATWITWTPGTGTCASPTGTFFINAQMNTDSVVGNRCYFANPRCKILVPSGQVGLSGAGLLTGFTDTALPSNVQSALNGQYFNAAMSDIRPEDAKFASLRMFTACGTAVSTGSQYYGLGYQTATPGVGNAVKESSLAGSGSFHVFDFNLAGTDPINGNALPGTYTVTPIGAVPVVVFVNPSNESGFGSLQVSNVNRATLAGYLDGTYGRTADLVPQTGAGGTVGSIVFVREPLSGTYNTMEYAIPNSIELQTSQDLGVAAVNAKSGSGIPMDYCNGSNWNTNQNPLAETATGLGRNATNSNGAGRYRAIGTGDEVAAVLKYGDSLGYSFWSAANFANATATGGKYLTVDGVDPLQEVWQDGLIPTSGNGQLGNVTLAHVKDGTYPIWSILRIISDNSLSSTVSTLVGEVANFLSPTQPDFVHASTLQIVRSHFAPPGIGAFPCSGTASTPSNGTSSGECGGDVGGLVYTIGSDKDFNTDTGSTLGNTGRRQ
jgi:hypothetical protein